MQPLLETFTLSKLDEEIEEYLKSDPKVLERDKQCKRIRLILEGVTIRKLNLDGKVEVFGSFSNGFKTGGSDLDIVFSGTWKTETVVSVLSQIAEQVEALGFENITKIFSANVPLLKFTDKKSLMEVDFCINNDLGVRNSLLLHAYNAFDERVLKLGRTVKDWAKKHELVGTTDGCLNSYAYMLLVLHYLLYIGAVTNLQAIAREQDLSVPMKDSKWGHEDTWETAFFEDVKSLPPSTNEDTVGKLLIGFFTFYTQNFDWRNQAVCMRLCRAGVTVDKYTLSTPTSEEQWYVEDPFDLKHNLAGKCSRNGKNRIIDAMELTLQTLTSAGSWRKSCPEGDQTAFFLKCRISAELKPDALLSEFEDLNLKTLYFPSEEGRRGPAFLEFPTSEARRRAHVKNEAFVVDGRLQLHYTSKHGLAEAQQSCKYSTYHKDSWKMEKQLRLFKAQQAQQPQQVHRLEASDPKNAGLPEQMQQMHMQQMMAMQAGMMPPMPGMPYGMPPGMMPPMPHGFNPFLPGQAPMAQQGAAGAKAKAGIQNKAVPKPQVAATKSATKATANAKIATQSDTTGWLSVPITNSLPKDKPVFTPDQMKTIEDLHTYFKQFKPCDIASTDNKVELQCSLKNEISPKDPGYEKLAEQIAKAKMKLQAA